MGLVGASGFWFVCQLSGLFELGRDGRMDGWMAIVRLGQHGQHGTVIDSRTIIREHVRMNWV